MPLIYFALYRVPIFIHFHFCIGFLGLVIGLGLLIIACCVGVFILLKKRKDRGEPLWRKRKPVADSMSKSILGGRQRGKGWVRTGDGDGDDEHFMENRSHVIGLSTPRSRSRSPNPEMYSNRDQGASASTVRLEAPGPYPDAFTARDSIDSLVEGPNQSKGKYHGIDDNDREDSKYTPSVASFERGTRFKEAI